jgi:hypothetical protein
MIVQIMPASKWHICLSPDEFEDVVAFGLTDDGRIIPLVVATDGKSIEEPKSDFLLAGPILFSRLERVANMRKNGLLPPLSSQR